VRGRSKKWESSASGNHVVIYVNLPLETEPKGPSTICRPSGLDTHHRLCLFNMYRLSGGIDPVPDALIDYLKLVHIIPRAVAKLRPISAIRLGVTKNQDSSASGLFGFVMAVILFQTCSLSIEIDFINEISSVRPS
jgi:hypothetical protein